MDSTSHPYVIEATAEGTPNDTAVLLVGTAAEAGLDPRYDIQRITRPEPGFRITEALAEALGGSLDGDLDAEPEPEPEPDLSGNKQSLAPEHDIHGAPTAVAYEDWDYADLKSAVTTRGIETEDKKTETLVAALRADDEALAAEEPTEDPEVPSGDETPSSDD